MSVVKKVVGVVAGVAGLLLVIWLLRKIPMVGPIVDSALTK